MNQYYKLAATFIISSIVLVGCGPEDETVDEPAVNNEPATEINVPIKDGVPEGVVAETGVLGNNDSGVELSEDPALATIKRFYKFMEDKNLRAAYEISSQEVPFDKFEFWYQDLSEINLKDIQKKEDDSYTFTSELTEGNVRTEYQVEMKADAEKILDSSSKKTKTVDMDKWPSYQSDEYGFEVKYPFSWRFNWNTPNGAGKGIAVTFWPAESSIYNKANPAITLAVEPGSSHNWGRGFSSDEVLDQATRDMERLFRKW